MHFTKQTRKPEPNLMYLCKFMYKNTYLKIKNESGFCLGGGAGEHAYLPPNRNCVLN